MSDPLLALDPVPGGAPPHALGVVGNVPDVEDGVIGPPEDLRHAGVIAVHQLLPLVVRIRTSVSVTSQSRLLANLKI